MKYLITGLTGAGLSTVKRVFEKNGFLVSYPKLSTFNPEYYNRSEDKHLIIIDAKTAIADRKEREELVDYYEQLYVKVGKDFTIMYFDASEDILFKRQWNKHIPPPYSKHFSEKISWLKSFKIERKILKPFFEHSKLIFDTSKSTSDELAQSIDLFINLKLEDKINVNSYQEFLSSLYENFWDNIGSKMSVFQEIKAIPEVTKRFLNNFEKKILKPLENANIEKKIKNTKRILLTENSP